MNVFHRVFHCSVWVEVFPSYHRLALCHILGIMFGSDSELFTMSERAGIQTLTDTDSNADSRSDSFCGLAGHTGTGSHFSHLCQELSELSSSDVISNEEYKMFSASIGPRSGMCGLLLTLSLLLYFSHFFTIFSHFSALSISSCFRCEETGAGQRKYY